VKKQKNGSLLFNYSGSLEKEIEKSKKELEKLTKLIPFLEFSYNEAKKVYESKTTRVSHLADFIDLAEKKLKEDRKEKKDEEI